MLRSRSLSEEYYDDTYKVLKEKVKIYIQGAKKRGKIKEINDLKNLIEEYNTSHSVVV